MPTPMQQSLTRLAWLEQQYQTLFQDAAKQFAQNQQLVHEQQRWHESHAKLLAENAKLLQANVDLTKSLDSMKQENASAERTKAALDRRVATLEAENEELKRHECPSNASSLRCARCSLRPGPSGLCGNCFMPATDNWPNGPRKMSTQVPYNSGYGETRTAVSDSEAYDSDDFRRRGVESRWDHHTNLYANTRLEDGAFEWLVHWCEMHADRIESRRVLERMQNGHEVRRLVQDLRDNDEEMEKMHKHVARMKVKRRSIKRKLLVFTDEEGLVSENGIALKEKVYLFCMIMASPKYDFHASGMPFVKTERDLVKIYHQVMSAMRVLHYDYVELPKLADRNFKHRNPSPAKWTVLKPRFGLRGDLLGNVEDPLVQNYVSSEQDARMACTALQNLLWSWKRT